MVNWIPIDYNTQKDKWLEFRTRGIGASSFGALLGYDKYKSNLELFYECIGEPTFSIENLRTISGRETEPLTAKFWKHWDGTTQSIVNNWDIKIVRECEPVNAFCVNDKYEGLYVSLDRRILPHGSFKGYGALELKNSIERVMIQWEGRVAPTHLIQNIVQCVCSEYEYGEVAVYIIDSGQFEVLPIHDLKPYGELIDGMMDEHKRFWNNVKEARGYYTAMLNYKMNFNYSKASEMQAEIERLEPPVQNTEVYRKFLTEKFKNRSTGLGIIKGTNEHYLAAKRHKELQNQIKEWQDKLRYEEIVLKQAIGAANRMEFDKKQGYVSWQQNSNGRPFLNKVA
jgi:hypothetical protein